jgi:hypothetical protein
MHEMEYRRGGNRRIEQEGTEETEKECYSSFFSVISVSSCSKSAALKSVCLAFFRLEL